jgi:N-acetylneuraminic acid mutarotase
MHKKSTSRSAFFSLRALIGLLFCAATAYFILIPIRTGLAFLHASSNASQSTLTFEERVSYQRAIEDVYWRHRIWPKERPDPKPSLDAVMSQAQLENKVTDYLRKSQALEDYWQRPITAEQLQAEMDRMAQHTKQPEVLRELFDALGNDPFVIAECLARPLVAEHLFQSVQGSREGNGKARQSTGPHNLDGTSSTGYTLPGIATSSDTEGTCIDDTWTATSLVGGPDARESHTTVWTGSEMIVWGGVDENLVPLNTGARYDPATDSWTATITTNAPAARYAHTAVWTGSEMIVWGGYDGNSAVNTGGKYDPGVDNWIATSTTNAPPARSSHTAVWTGTEMIIWGGSGVGGPFVDSGGSYNSATNSWTATSTANAPTPRYLHTAVWTGSEMIVWGGYGSEAGPCCVNLNTGGKYNPGTNSWTATSITNVPDARYDHTAVWTGSEMIVWGGYDGGFTFFSTGGKYSPGANSWTATGVDNAPEGRSIHTAVWAGTEMIVWGGWDDFTALNTGSRYNPAADHWSATSTTNAPSARLYHTTVWTDSEMIVWGGFDGGNNLDTGGRYCAEGGPTPTPTVSPTPTGTPTPTATPRATPRPRPTPHPRPTPP